MQLLNKEASKRIFAHTWYLYPLFIGITTLLWYWGFQAFHLPSAHQQLVMFFATNIYNESFATDLQNYYYAPENLRQVSAFHSLPSATGYYSKLQIYLNKSDILVLDKKTIDEFKGYQDRFFVEINDYVINYYGLSNYEYYEYTDASEVTHKYGIKLKGREEEHFLQRYMMFDEGYDYYIMLSISSVNLGFVNSMDNIYYDNAITYMKHLLELKI